MDARRTVLVATAGLCFGMAQPAQAFFDVVNSAAQGLQSVFATPPANANASAAAVTASCANGKAAAAGACSTVPPMQFTRPVAQFDTLLTGEEISGADLMAEMAALRKAIASNSLNGAMQSLMGAGGASLASMASSNNSGGFFSSLFSSAGHALLDLLTTELSYQALNAFFAQFADKPGLLKEVKVTLPKAEATMSPEMKQQLVTAGAFLVAIKASGKVIDASENDFNSAVSSYQRVLAAREAAARLLGEAFYTREQLLVSEKEAKARGVQFLSEEESAYLESLKGRKPEEFMRDFGAQNIALAYLRKVNPKEYGDYKIQLDDFKTHYGAYTRTAVGAASMLGFSSLFLKRIKNIAEKNGLQAAPALLPLVGSGLSEIVTLAPRVYKTLENSPDMQEGSFVVVPPDPTLSTRNLSAEKVFATIPLEMRSSFQGELFKNGQAGYFGKLGDKYPQLAGNVLDSLVEKENRKLFVKNYLQLEDAPDFSFQNALLDGSSRKTRELKAALFRSAPALTANSDDEKAVASVQKDVREKLGKWNNSALRRLIFANREREQSAPSLLLNGYKIAIDSPGMKGIMDYEEMALASVDHATVRKADKERTGDKEPARAGGRKKAK